MTFPVLADYITKIKRQPDVSFIFLRDKTAVHRVPINESAVSILELCNGRNSDTEIVDILAKKYSESLEKVKKLVSDFIDYSLQIGFLTLEQERREKEKKVGLLGDKNQWIPDSIVLELTTDCPLNCRHCYLDCKKPLYMDYNKLLNICRELADIGADAIQLTGGEPLIYPRIKDIIDYLCDNQITTAITTSGFISQSRLEDLLPSLKKIAYANGVIQLSVDGFEIHHNALRGNPDSFKRAVYFIDKTVEQNIQLQVATLVTEDSLEEIGDFSKFLKDKGVKVHRIGFIFDRGRARDNSFNTDADYIKGVKQKITDLKAALEDDNFKIMELDDVKDHQNYLFYKNCGAGTRFFRISPDFKLYPCSLIDIPIGDLNIQTMNDLFQESPQKYTKIPAPGKEICGDCRMLIRCEGCFAEALINKDKVTNCLWYDSSMGINPNKGGV